MNMQSNLSSHRLYTWFVLVSLLLFSPSLQAQGVAEVWLKKAAQQFQQKGVDLSFRINEDGVRLSGKLLMEGKRFTFLTDEMKIWYDGTTQWTLQMDQDYTELYISNPTPDEQQSINPYLLLSNYQNSFTATDGGEKTVNGKLLHLVTLKAKDDRQELSELNIYLANDGTPNALELIFPDERVYKIEVRSMRNGLTFPQRTFTYQEKDFPADEVIDMR